MTEKVIVVGLGEVGKPLMELIQERYDVFGVDIDTTEQVPPCDIMHICFGFDGENFVRQTLRYIEKYKPAVTIIDSTVAPGTTRRIATESGRSVVHSPVRGKHAKMKEQLLHYTKFIGYIEREAGAKAYMHFENIRMRPKLVSSPEATELSKLTETTYFGVLIAWSQEVERYCAKVGVNYDEVISFCEEIKFLPAVK